MFSAHSSISLLHIWFPVGTETQVGPGCSPGEHPGRRGSGLQIGRKKSVNNLSRPKMREKSYVDLILSRCGNRHFSDGCHVPEQDKGEILLTDISWYIHMAWQFPTPGTYLPRGT